MMLFMDLSAALRQIMVILCFFCFISVVPLTAVFHRRKQTENILFSALLMLLSYCCIQIMSGIAKRLTEAYSYGRFALWVTELPVLPMLALFTVTLALFVLLTVRAAGAVGGKAPDTRFSALKVRLHDTFGLSLVASKAYYDGQEIDRDTVRLLYSRCRECFRDEQFFSSRTYESVCQIGKLIGVDLAVTGELPENDTVRPVVCAAITECMLNTFRHAWGDTVFADIFDGKNTEIIIRNNGKQPAGPIQEKGGLKHLRGYAESLGIAMTVESVPQFSLTLTIPKEVQHGL